jgi:hypothetical protein
LHSSARNHPLFVFFYKKRSWENNSHGLHHQCSGEMFWITSEVLIPELRLQELCH